jgi:cytochrome c556
MKALLISSFAVLLTTSALAQVNSSGTAITEEEAEGIIFERQNIMAQLSDDTELLGDIVAGIAPIEKLGPVTASIAQSAQASQEAFQLQVRGGRAKEEVWTNNEDYRARMAEFTQNTARLAQLGEKGDVAGVTSMLVTALPCKQCHDVYRAPKD